jgi:hypothetical protein
MNTEKEKKKARPKASQKITEVIEFSDSGEIIGWCKVLRDLGLLKCPGKCETCHCG